MKQGGEKLINTFPGTIKYMHVIFGFTKLTIFYVIIYFTWKLFYPFTKTSHKMIPKRTD